MERSESDCGESVGHEQRQSVYLYEASVHVKCNRLARSRHLEPTATRGSQTKAHYQNSKQRVSPVTRFVVVGQIHVGAAPSSVCFSTPQGYCSKD